MTTGSLDLDAKIPNNVGLADDPEVRRIIQRAINTWFSSCLDLFGGEISHNAADYFAAGLKGRSASARGTRITERPTAATA